MIDNFRLLSFDERAFYHSHERTFSDDGDKLLLRFLKERGLMSRFHRLFNDIENGLRYRKYLYEHVSVSVHMLAKETITCFCSTYALKDYFLNAFMWGYDNFWSNVHREWLEYLDENGYYEQG